VASGPRRACSSRAPDSCCPLIGRVHPPPRASAATCVVDPSAPRSRTGPGGLRVPFRCRAPGSCHPLQGGAGCLLGPCVCYELCHILARSGLAVACLCFRASLELPAACAMAGHTPAGYARRLAGRPASPPCRWSCPVPRASVVDLGLPSCPPLSCAWPPQYAPFLATFRFGASVERPPPCRWRAALLPLLWVVCPESTTPAGLALAAPSPVSRLQAPAASGAGRARVWGCRLPRRAHDLLAVPRVRSPPLPLGSPL